MCIIGQLWKATEVGSVAQLAVCVRPAYDGNDSHAPKFVVDSVNDPVGATSGAMPIFQWRP